MTRWNIRYFLREGFSSIFSHGLMSFAAVCMIVACLLIMGSFSLVAVNMSNMLGDLERENEFLAYVDDSLSEEEARALESRLLAVSNVASVLFVSREQALQDFLSDKQENDLYADLPDSVLRHRYRIHVVDIERMESTVTAVKGVPGIGTTSAALEIAKGFVAARNVASAVSFILIAILLIVSLFIIANTIRLATFHRRDEIAIMKMCGATNGFIRWPFMIEGLILGLLGAGLAFFLQWGVYSLISRAVTGADAISLITLLDFKTLAPKVLGIFAGTGFLVGVGGSLLAIRRFLQV